MIAMQWKNREGEGRTRPAGDRMRLGILTWEGDRWLSPWVFSLLVAAWAVFYLLDTCSYDLVILQWESGEPLPFCVLRYLLCSPPQLQNAGLCCVVFAGAGLYAQDYGENAAYMRIQRMGVRQYAGLRTLQASVGSWLVGCAGMLLAVLLISLTLQVPVLPQETKTAADWTDSSLLQAGQNMEFLVWLVGMAGFRSMFYAVVTFAFSFFVPKRQVLFALPMLLWYFNQYALVWVGWIPNWLQPRVVFDFGNAGLFGSVSEWGVLWWTALGMACLAVAVWALFVLRLRGAGIFGGEQNE